MSIRIGSNMTSFYNASRINPAQDIDRASRVEKKNDVALDLQDGRSNGQYVAKDHGGVIQTRVSDANAFQKTQLDSSRERIEEMANKLFDKLPNILNDMQKLPENTGAEDQAARVAVTERNAAAVADRQAQQAAELQNFSL